MPSSFTRDSSPSSRASSPPKYPPPSYGATHYDLEAAIADPVKSKGSNVVATEVRMEPAWMAWRRERMQILGPVQQDKRILLWVWAVLCILAITLGIGLGLAYKKPQQPSD